MTVGLWHIYLFSRLSFSSSISQKKWLSAEVRGERTMGYFIVKKEFTNQDDDKKTKYQPSDVKINDSGIPDRRLENWEKRGWIEWHK